MDYLKKDQLTEWLDKKYDENFQLMEKACEEKQGYFEKLMEGKVAMIRDVKDYILGRKSISYDHKPLEAADIITLPENNIKVSEMYGILEAFIQGVESEKGIDPDNQIFQDKMNHTLDYLKRLKEEFDNPEDYRRLHEYQQEEAGRITHDMLMSNEPIERFSEVLIDDELKIVDVTKEYNPTDDLVCLAGMLNDLQNKNESLNGRFKHEREICVKACRDAFELQMENQKLLKKLGELYK